MKLLILIVCLGFALQISAQTTSDQPKRTIEQVESFINSIKIKMEYVQSNPVEDSIARAQGWYDLMNSQLDELNAERDKLMGVQPKKQIISKEEWSKMTKEEQENVLSHPEKYTMEK